VTADLSVTFLSVLFRSRVAEIKLFQTFNVWQATCLNQNSNTESFHLGDAAEIHLLVVRGRLRLALPMQVRHREEDVLVEERSSG